MIKTKLLIAGLCTLLFQNFIAELNQQIQLILFFSGILFLGIPHGAADLLVANKNAQVEKKKFSKIIFFVKYLGNLTIFGLLVYFLPVIGILLFIAFAAYHFGETDLHELDTSSVTGKLFIFSYGLLILSTILLTNFESIKSLFAFSGYFEKNAIFFSWVQNNNYFLLSLIGVFFFLSTFLYFSTTGKKSYHKDRFLIELGIIIIILFNLPMLLGFTFYFVFWHSLLSLQKIVKYLHKDNFSNPKKTVTQIGLFSAIAIAGILVFGISGIMFTNTNTQIIYIIFGLAVLTAPHMQIMYEMYAKMREKNLEHNQG